MSNIPHAAVLQQLTVPQPKALVVLLFCFIPTWLPTVLSHLLVQWPDFVAFISIHEAGYRLTFFLVQLGLICGALVFLSARYTSALWTPPPSWRRGIRISVLILLPLFLYQVSKSISGVRVAMSLSEVGENGRSSVAFAHNYVWSRLAYASSLDGVVHSSVMSFVAPVLEEIIFSGFVVNIIARPYGFTAAVVGSALCFALAHVFQFGFGLHLNLLFASGLTYASIRVCSGSLLLAVLAHCMINAVIFLPKWVIALRHFW